MQLVDILVDIYTGLGIRRIRLGSLGALHLRMRMRVQGRERDRVRVRRLRGGGSADVVAGRGVPGGVEVSLE